MNKPMLIPAPPGKTYLPYQQAFVRYAIGADGTLLADEMGLGKTISAIGLINAMRAMRVLVIAPAGLALNWKNELDEWLVKLPGQSIRVVSYAKAYRDIAELPAVLFHWDLLIVDEAHYIKNPKSARSQAVKRIARNAKRKLLLTGTPIENRPVELWPLLQIVAPKEFDPPTPSFIIGPKHRKSHPGEGPNFWAFCNRYCDLKMSTYRSKGRKHYALDFSGASNLNELGLRLRRTCMVRRKKEDVLPQLPDKRRQVIVLTPRKPINDSALLPDLTEENYGEQVRKLAADERLREYGQERLSGQVLRPDGTMVHLIECNPRFWYNMDVAMIAGINFVELGCRPVASSRARNCASASGTTNMNTIRS